MKRLLLNLLLLSSLTCALSAQVINPPIYVALPTGVNPTLASLSNWQSVTPEGTNAVLDVTAAANFYYTITTSNYITFSNLVAGACGTVLIFTGGNVREVNFSSSYNNFSTNETAPVFTVTNQAIIAYQVSFGTNPTNVLLAIKRK
jgi:hypothetical protein